MQSRFSRTSWVLAGTLTVASAVATPPQFIFAIPQSRSAIPVPTPAIPPGTPNVAPYEFVYQAPRSFEFLDFDRDGYLDIFVAPAFAQHLPYLPVEIWLNGRNGTFANGTSSVIDGAAPQTWNPTDVLMGDFNEDGRDDVFMVCSGGEFAVANSDPVQGFHNVLLLSQPNGKYADATAGVTPNLDTFNHMGAIGDFNGDRHLDAAVNAFGTQQRPAQGVRLLVGNGSGQLIETIQGLSADIAFLNSQDRAANADWQITGCVGLADLDGDNVEDLITGSYSGNDIPSGQRTVRFYRRNAGGIFAEQSRTPIPPAIADIGYSADTVAGDPNGFGLGCSQIIAGDLDGDGRKDLLVQWEGAGKWYLEILRNQGGFQFTDVTPAALGGYDMGFVMGSNTRSGPGHHRLRDLNGDGTLDIVNQLSPTSLDYLIPHVAFLNDGSARFTPLVPYGNAGPLTAAQFASGSVCTNCLYSPFVFDTNNSGLASLVLLDFQSSVTVTAPVTTTVVYLTTFTPVTEVSLFKNGFE